MSRQINVMLDLETLGKRAGCAILSIGATTFRTSEPLKEFYEKICIDSCKTAQLGADQDTLRWWSLQSVEAQEEAFSGTKELKSVLHEFIDYLSSLGPKDQIYIWANGAAFDLPILEAAYVACGIAVPWDFRNVRCYRTLKALFPYVVPPQDNTLKHSAIADAIYQAAHATELLKEHWNCLQNK